MKYAYIHGPIEANARTMPEKIAVRVNDRALMYQALWNNIQRVADILAAKLDRGSRVGVVLENSIEALCTVYGAPLAGMLCVPMDANIHRRNFDFIAKDCQMSLVVTSRRLSSRLRLDERMDGVEILQVEDLGVISDGHVVSEYRADGHDSASPTNTAMILYTTGTTGPSKGVELTHSNLMAATYNINAFVGTTQSAIESVPMPLSHSFGLARVRCVLAMGGTVLLENGLVRPERVLSNMREYRANALSAVPGAFALLLDRFRQPFEEIARRLSYVEIGSAPMTLEHKKALLSMCPNARICMHYGLTEASRATFLEFHGDKDHLDTVGRPTPGVVVKIAGEDGAELGKENIGAIMIKGEMVAKGYWRHKKLTLDTFHEGWVRSGDFGFIDTDGYVHLVGREEDIINLGGMKVGPAEIEQALIRYEFVQDAAVVAVSVGNSSGLPTVKAFVVPKNHDQVLDLDELRRHCLLELEPYKVPRIFETVDTLPRTSSGKLQRHLLRGVIAEGRTVA